VGKRGDWDGMTFEDKRDIISKLDIEIYQAGDLGTLWIGEESILS